MTDAALARPLARVREGRGFGYRAARTREELLGARSDELIDRLLGRRRPSVPRS